MGVGTLILIYGVIGMSFFIAVLYILGGNRWPQIGMPTIWKVLMWIVPLISIMILVGMGESSADDVLRLTVSIPVAIGNIFVAHIARAWSTLSRWYLALLLPSFLLGIIFVGMVMVFIRVGF